MTTPRHSSVNLSPWDMHMITTDRGHVVQVFLHDNGVLTLQNHSDAAAQVVIIEAGDEAYDHT